MNTNEITNHEIELIIEEAEAVIAPALNDNHSETVEIELTVEEAETVVAPGIPLI